MRYDAQQESPRCSRCKPCIAEHGLENTEVERVCRDEQDNQGWPKQLREIDDKVLIMWMEAMLGKIASLGIVQDIIEWCDYRSMADVIV